MRRFLARFEGRALEVALEATTGWRFVVEELAAIGARPEADDRLAPQAIAAALLLLLEPGGGDPTSSSTS